MKERWSFTAACIDVCVLMGRNSSKTPPRRRSIQCTINIYRSSHYLCGLPWRFSRARSTEFIFTNTAITYLILAMTKASAWSLKSNLTILSCNKIKERNLDETRTLGDSKDDRYCQLLRIVVVKPMYRPGSWVRGISTFLTILLVYWTRMFLGKYCNKSWWASVLCHLNSLVRHWSSGINDVEGVTLLQE